MEVSTPNTDVTIFCVLCFVLFCFVFNLALLGSFLDFLDSVPALIVFIYICVCVCVCVCVCERGWVGCMCVCVQPWPASK